MGRAAAGAERSGGAFHTRHRQGSARLGSAGLPCRVVLVEGVPHPTSPHRASPVLYFDSSSRLLPLRSSLGIRLASGRGRGGGEGHVPAPGQTAYRAAPPGALPFLCFLPFGHSARPPPHFPSSSPTRQTPI